MDNLLTLSCGDILLFNTREKEEINDFTEIEENEELIIEDFKYLEDFIDIDSHEINDTRYNFLYSDILNKITDITRNIDPLIEIYSDLFTFYFNAEFTD